MRDTYAELYYHFVWSTKDRVPYITRVVEAKLHDYIDAKAKSLGAYVFAINGTDDHIHVACTLPPRIAPADFMHVIKGASSHFVRTAPSIESFIAWQIGYGVKSYASDALPAVIAYVRNQKQHHAESTLMPEFEPIDQVAPEALSVNH